jgi:thymidine phosphorylase
MVESQGGDASKLERITQVHRAPVIRELCADRSGCLMRMDAGTVGRAVLELGAGRSKASDPVDFAVGCDQIAKVGTEVQTGDVLLRIHARSELAAEEAIIALGEGIVIE